MELLEILANILTQYRGTRVERLVMALLMPIQDNLDLAKRIGEFTNTNGHGIALDLLGNLLHYPRPLVPDIEGEYFGFKLDDVPPGEPRLGFNQAPFFDSQGSIYQRTEAGDRIYRSALRARGAQLWGNVSYEMLARVAVALGGPSRTPPMFSETPLSIGQPDVDIENTMNGGCVWHDGNLYVVGASDQGSYRLLRGQSEPLGEFKLETNDSVTGRQTLVGAAAGLSSHADDLYCILRDITGGGYIYRVNEINFSNTLVPSNVGGLPTPIDAAIILNDNSWLATRGRTAYTCSWGGASQRITHTDSLPRSLTSLAIVENEIWGLGTDGRFYRRNPSNRTFSAVSARDWRRSGHAGTSLMACSGGSLIIIDGSTVTAFPVKLAQGYGRAVSVWLRIDDRGIRNIVDATKEQLLPRTAGIPFAYDFYYPR